MGSFSFQDIITSDGGGERRRQIKMYESEFEPFWITLNFEWQGNLRYDCIFVIFPYWIFIAKTNNIDKGSIMKIRLFDINNYI